MSQTISEQLVAQLRGLYGLRRNELGRYLDLLEFIAAAGPVEKLPIKAVSSRGTSEFIISRDLVKTLKANGYLLIYNLIEATMTNALDAIHRALEADKVEYGHLRRELKSIVLKHFKGALSQRTEELLERIEPIQLDIVTFGYDKQEMFSGNVDDKRIKNTAKLYGFAVAEHDRKASRDGARLRDVKDMRNELAHGKRSFEECGQDISPEELKEIAAQTIEYLNAVIDGVAEYLESRAYLADPPNAA